MSNTNDIFQVDYLPDEKKIKINLPEEVWKNIDTVIMTRLFQEELVVEKQKEIEVEEEVEDEFPSILNLDEFLSILNIFEKLQEFKDE